ncbi:uncharacterized protein [Gorilla gorilla gorilla]|uniref:uncharacterized protein isoform X3 n=1 Tax=Gorilla gorilla gorilla TaxID=9595 RepID=UPI00300BA1F8
MSESSSGQNTSSQEICPSNSSYYSDPSETHTGSAPSRRRTFHPCLDSGISSLLPSDSCKYLTWHKVEQHDVQGSQLRCPRVREGPSEEEQLFRQVECALLPRKRVLEKNKWETWLQENWEDCKNSNISFQDLGDPYQVENFNRILRRLIRVETLCCRILNMSKNHLTSFKQLPKIPQIQHLSLAENHIETLTGFSSLRCTPLESLILKRNPYPPIRRQHNSKEKGLNDRTNNSILLFAKLKNAGWNLEATRRLLITRNQYFFKNMPCILMQSV